MEFKGTKGEWQSKIAQDEDFVYVDCDRPTHNVADVYGYSFEEAQANAKLIAAAPELLKALQGIIKLIDDDDLVRNTEKDDDFKYFMDQGIRITGALAEAELTIKKALGHDSTP